MCQFLEIEFSCSDETKRHSQRTDALCLCDNPLVCIAGDMQLDDDTEPDISELGEDRFKVLKVDGVCDECAQKMARELQEKDKMFTELEANLEEINKDLNQLTLGAQAEGQAGNGRKPSQQDAAPIKPQHPPQDHRWICSYGPCQRRITFSIDGRRGRFCQKHTCAAHDWGCLSGVVTKLNNPQFSIYCPVHSCAKAGCGMRIADDSAIYCCTHVRS
ncbi:hypothetical protein ACHAPT_003966 [Fusarium lateritium]